MAVIGPGRRIVASPGCGEPTTLLAALAEGADALRGSVLYSGLLLGDYPFMAAVRAGVLSYGTWHVGRPVRRPVAEGVVDFFPVRGSQVPALLRHLKIDTALVRVSPPDRHGFCSLGPTASYPIAAVRLAHLVVAEIDETVPRTRGEGVVHLSDIDIAVPSEHPMPEYPRAEPDEISSAIAGHILGLLPPGPTIQIGLGSIPEALIERLRTAGVDGLRFAGMAIDGMADLYDAGLMARQPLVPYPPILAIELMGTRRLMDFAHDNPVIGMYGSELSNNAHRLAGIDRFVSINSAIEVDLRGQVNSETVGPDQLTGIGGSVDFFESALHSRGGVRIIAIPSANVRDGASRVVRNLQHGAPVTIARHSVDYVVTEHGVASLGLASDRERAEALVAIAHPAHRSELGRRGDTR